MTAFEARGEYAVADFIRDLLRENGVSHGALEFYKLLNEDKILHINNIFSLKTEEDVRQCAVLLRLLCPEYADEVSGYFLNGNLPDTCFGLNDVERYKLKLLTGLEYNYKFFALAWNWQTSMREKALEIREPELGPARDEKPKKNKHSIINSWPSNRLSRAAINVGSLNMMQRASTKNSNLLLHKRFDDDDLGDNIRGDLYIIDRTEGKIESYFVFTEYPEKIPYLKIKVGGKEILLEKFVPTRPDEKEKIITSGSVPTIDPEDSIFIEILSENKNG